MLMNLPESQADEHEWHDGAGQHAQINHTVGHHQEHTGTEQQCGAVAEPVHT